MFSDNFVEREIDIFGAATDGHIRFVVMEYTPGDSVQKLLVSQDPVGTNAFRWSGMIAKRNRGMPSQAVHVGSQIAEALDYAWKKHSMVHKDIKPANVMVDSHGKAKLMDMGISSMFGVDSDQLNKDHIVGTPDYMSPEQMTGDTQVDLRDDMYALGASLYHIVTGKAPFGDGTPEQIIARRGEEKAPDPCKLASGVSPACGDLIEAMMAQSREERHSSWDKVIEDIDRVIDGKRPAKRLASGKSSVQRDGDFKTVNKDGKHIVVPVAAKSAGGRRPVPVVRKSGSDIGTRLKVIAITVVLVGIVAAVVGVNMRADARKQRAAAARRACRP